MELVLLAIVLAAAACGGAAFALGERRRRAVGGRAGPRPAPSIGEALRRCGRPGGKVLVVFLGADPASAALERALGEDAALRDRLGRPGIEHAVVRAEGEAREVAEHLHAKYAGAPLPSGAAALLLDVSGDKLGAAQAPVAEPGQAADLAWLEPLLP